MKTTVDLPNDLVREIKLRAVNEGRKMKDIVTDLLRFGLEQGANHPKAPLAQKGEIAIPFFPCSSDAPASKMSVDALIALEQAAQLEEDHARL
jgi:plasmid stability protein